MVEIVIALDHNAQMERSLLPEVDDVCHFMQGTGKRIPTAKEGRLAQVHEASHAVMMVVLRGYACEEIVVREKERHARLVKSDTSLVPEGNIDIIDLAGLYAEVRELGEKACAWQHIQNAFHDLETARKRIGVDRAGEAAWARQQEPIARRMVEYFWPTIVGVAAEVPCPPDTGRLGGPRILELVAENLPVVATPEDLRPHLKVEFVAVAQP